MNTAGLLKHQGSAAEILQAALEKHGGALDASEMGVGKTAQVLAAFRNQKDVPTLIVGPMIAETGWRRLGAHLGVKFSYSHYEALRYGNTPFGWWDNPRPKVTPKKLKCDMCQQVIDPLAKTILRCPYQPLGIHCVRAEKYEHQHGKFNWHPNIRRLAFDEVHRCGAIDSLQADMLLAARRQRIPTIGASATVADSPLDLRALGAVIGLHNYVDFYQWAGRHGCRRVPWGGFQFLLGEENKKKVMAKLHEEIFPERGCRVKIDSLGTDFPAVEITAELYNLQEGNLVQRLYEEMDEAIQVINAARVGDGGLEHPLTVLLRARQEIELLKVPIFVELALEANAQGKHCAICVVFRRTVDEICKRLKTDCRVDGSQIGAEGAKRRRANLDAFQDDREPNIVLSAAAGSASIDLHDVRGNFPRVGYASVGTSAEQTRQWLGRLRRAGGKSTALYRFVLAAGTVEEKVHKAIACKLNCLDALNNGDIYAANLPLRSGSLANLFSPEAD